MENKKIKTKYSTLSNSIYSIKNIWRWDKGLFALSFLQILAAVLMPLLSIYLPKILIDSVSGHVKIPVLIRNIGIPIIGIITLNILLNIIMPMNAIKASFCRFKYLILITEKVMDTDFENVEGPAAQQKFMKAYMTVDANFSGTQKIIEVGIQFFTNIIGFMLYASIISTIHPIIVLLLILSALINYFVGNYVNEFEYKNKDNLAPIERKLRYIVNKTGEFKAAKDIRLYNMFPWFKDLFLAMQSKKIHFEKKNIYHRYFANFIDGLLIFLRDGLAYGFLIYLVIYKDMTIGNFVLYFGAVTGFSTWLSGIVKNVNSLNSCSLEICDLREYLEMEDKMNRGQGVELPKHYEMPCDIELKHVYYKYPEAEDYTIKDMNIYIKKGEKVALVGVNGAGKTTLVKLICGLYSPTKGEIYINGKRSSLYNRDEYYTLFSVVFQDMHLLPVSIEKNISLENEGDRDNKKVDKVIYMSGLKEKVGTLPRGKDTVLVKSVYEEAIDLSGGEMQKLMLARALYKEAPIIILDEPTAALDPIAENEIYEKYNKLTKDHTSIFISHRLSSTRFCDRILFIENGSILEEGTHDMLMGREGKYKEMYDMQSYYYKENIGGEKYA